tara:strand:- start:362 stop:616 length:255 start_codon:yes stop_codon:yes gene_type:complete
MARFILDVASKNSKISSEELKKVIDIHREYFGTFVSTITLVDETNENQFHEEELEKDPSLNDLNNEQINNFKKSNRKGSAINVY